MPTMNIDALNQAIKAAGADWVAAETPYSRLADRPPSTEGLGLALTPEDAYRDLRATRAGDATMFLAAPPALPPAIDWRNYKGKNWVTPVRDQKSCGSCVAFATVAMAESRVLIAKKKPGVDFDLSEAGLFYCGTPNACAVGWLPLPALNYTRRYGLGREAAFPYTPGNQPCRRIPKVVKTGSPLTAAMMVARKQALLSGPVVAGFAVYGDFYSYVSGVYRHIQGNFAGNHAVCVVGYDDKAGCWIVKNSWGAGWGEGGFFRIRYGECGIDSQFPFYYPAGVTVEPGTSIP